MGGGDLVSAVDQIIENVFRLHTMRTGTQVERRFHDSRIKNGKLFVVVESQGNWAFAPSKFCGYLENGMHHSALLGERDGRKTNVVIDRLLGKEIDSGQRGYLALDSAFLDYCDQHGIIPSKHHRPRRYWSVGLVNTFPDEVPITAQFSEGSVSQILVNRYERDPAARAACIAHFGYKCQVCSFDFEARYGEIGRNFIHVHHLVPLSDISAEYAVNPLTDMIPVCPNCHAMLHRGTELLQPEFLRMCLLDSNYLQ